MASLQKINSQDRPQKPLYSHAVKASGLIFLSGQVPVDKDGNPVPGDIQAHTTQCLRNLTDVLNAADSSWDKVVKVNIYLKDMDDFDRVNEAYMQFVPEPRPARTCIQAGRLPNDFDVEIEAIAAA
ncbi:Endoribonuclease L-PSP/chorismate mutase-like protein [Tylopilus felleus]|jgi:reactive intermediate/imine deaminase